MKRIVSLYLDAGVVAELRKRGVNISQEVNAYLASLVGKTTEPKKGLAYGNAVPDLNEWAWNVFHVLSVGSIWAEQGIDPPEERVEWLTKKAERLGMKTQPLWWNSRETVMEMARRCGFKVKEWMEVEREKVRFGDLLRETDLLNRMVEAILLSQESGASEKAKVSRGG
jgi:hypothetical protein